MIPILLYDVHVYNKQIIEWIYLILCMLLREFSIMYKNYPVIIQQ